MPQFDFYSFSTQVFYILFGFIAFHFFILNYVTIPYAQVLKLRYKIINTFLTNYKPAKQINKPVYDSILELIIFYFLICNSSAYTRISTEMPFLSIRNIKRDQRFNSLQIFFKSLNSWSKNFKDVQEIKKANLKIQAVQDFEEGTAPKVPVKDKSKSKSSTKNKAKK